MRCFRDMGLVFLVLLVGLFVSCAREELSTKVEPLESDLVLSVFEVKTNASGPCASLATLSFEVLGESGWAVSFPKEQELLDVLDCRREGEDVLFESVNRVLGWEDNQIGWGFLTHRTTPGGLKVAISGQGEGDIGLGRREGERVVFIDVEIQHTTGQHVIKGPLRYEGPWPSNATLLLHRRAGESPRAPWLCVALEPH